MKCKCLGRYATWVCRAVLAGSLLMAPMVTENFVTASNASTSVTTTDEADAILKEAKAIVAQPETFYTLYVGMPHSDFRANFSNLPGWQQVRYHDNYKDPWITKKTASWEYERMLPMGNRLVKQNVRIWQLYNGPIYNVGVTFVIPDKATAAKMYKEMYTVLKNRYPAFETAVPYRLTTNHHYTPIMQASPGVWVQLLFYKSLGIQKGPASYEVYYMLDGGQAYNLY